MRFADILRLALSALWQQKARTLLTVLGVVFGSFVLAASLSINQGVQETIERESHRSDHLRRLDVRPGWAGQGSDLPEEELRVQGEMSDARRKRIREALAVRKLRFHSGGPRVPLTRERLRALAEIEHVAAVVPVVWLNGWAVFAGHSVRADAVSAQPDNAALQKRVVAGRFFDAPDEHSAVVSEFSLYQWGVTDEAAVYAVLGKKIRYEYRAERSPGGIGVYLVKPDGEGTTRVEAAALDKIKSQLPEALDKFGLSPAEHGALRDVLRVAAGLTSTSSEGLKRVRLCGISKVLLPVWPFGATASARARVVGDQNGMTDWVQSFRRTRFALPRPDEIPAPLQGLAASPPAAVRGDPLHRCTPRLGSLTHKTHSA